MKSEAGDQAEARCCQYCWRSAAKVALQKSTSVVLRRTFGCLRRRLADDFDDAYPEELAMEACSHHQTTQHMHAVVYRIESDCVE